MKLVVPSSGSMIHTNSESLAPCVVARFLGPDAVAGVGREQRLDDGLLAGMVDFGDEVVDLLLRDAHGLDVERGPVDDGAGGAGGLDGHVEHGVQAWGTTWDCGS